MKKSQDIYSSTTPRQLPPHAYHPNPSLNISRRPFIAMPD